MSSRPARLPRVRVRSEYDRLVQHSVTPNSFGEMRPRHSWRRSPEIKRNTTELLLFIAQRSKVWVSGRGKALVILSEDHASAIARSQRVASAFEVSGVIATQTSAAETIRVWRQVNVVAGFRCTRSRTDWQRFRRGTLNLEMIGFTLNPSFREPIQRRSRQCNCTMKSLRGV